MTPGNSWSRKRRKMKRLKHKKQMKGQLKRGRMAACAEDSWQAGEEGSGLLNVVQRR